MIEPHTKQFEIAFNNHIFEPTVEQNQAIMYEYTTVVITFLSTKEKGFIPNVKVQVCNHAIDFSSLVKFIREAGYPVDGKLIYYYSAKKNYHIFCGKDPLPSGLTIPAEELTQVRENGCQIEIAVGQSFSKHMSSIPEPAPKGKAKTIKAKKMISAIKSVTTIEEEGDEDEDKDEVEEIICIPQIAEKKNAKRKRDRRIGEVVERVKAWRKLCGKTLAPGKGKTKMMTQKEAADRLGISLNALTNDFKRIRAAERRGFPLQDHYDAPMSYLLSWGLRD